MKDHDKPINLARLVLFIVGVIILIWGGGIALITFIVVKMLRWLDVIC